MLMLQLIMLYTSEVTRVCSLNSARQHLVKKV